MTAEITERTLRIHADHVLRGYEAVATRLVQTIAAATSGRPASRGRSPSRLARDAELLPELDRQLRRRFPDEPYRQRFGFIAERLRRTRAAPDRPAGAADRPLRGAGRARRRAGRDPGRARRRRLGRVAWGEVADFRWQLATFGFHLASLEVRQHSASTRAAVAAHPRAGRPATGGRAGRHAAEVLATFRASPRSRRGSGEPAIAT